MAYPPAPGPCDLGTPANCGYCNCTFFAVWDCDLGTWGGIGSLCTASSSPGTNTGWDYDGSACGATATATAAGSCT